MASTPSTPEQGSQQQQDSPDTQDELKRKFREALERKQGRHADKVDNDEAGNKAKVGGHAHGPAKNTKNFRRKSGG